VRFRDLVSNNVIGDPSLAFDVSADGFSWRTPPVNSGSYAILDFSFNKQDWQTLLIPG
jgi:hypothetical protein